tara:strand:- start:607 stop:873 length:267 start_codon:yes stop_codon:yes gene_type:complete
MAKNKKHKPTIKELNMDLLNLKNTVNTLIKHSIKMETTIVSYIVFKNDKHKYNEWMKAELKKQEKEAKDERRDTKDDRRAETHQESGV